MLVPHPLSRLAFVTVLTALAVPVAATSHAYGSVDIAYTRAALMRLDTRAAVERAALLQPLGARIRRRRLQLSVDDLLSASSDKDRALQINAAGDKIVSARLSGQDIVARGVDYDAASGLMAIAAVSQVLLYDPASGAVTVVAGPVGGAFDFANDVAFDGAGGLIIVDEGAETVARLPNDGAVWRYDLAGAELVEIAMNRALSNPKLLARDKKGVIHFIDGGSGALVSPAFDVRWDVLYRLEGRKLNTVKVVWGGAGIQATAYDVDRGGWHWIVNVGELVRIKGNKFQQPCLPPYPLQFATGLSIVESGDAKVIDGADVLTKSRAIYTINTKCKVKLSTDRKLKGARSLAHVPAE